jgi:hypothetical protein
MRPESSPGSWSWRESGCLASEPSRRPTVGSRRQAASSHRAYTSRWPTSATVGQAPGTGTRVLVICYLPASVPASLARSGAPPDGWPGWDPDACGASGGAYGNDAGPGITGGRDCGASYRGDADRCPELAGGPPACIRWRVICIRSVARVARAVRSPRCTLKRERHITGS